MEVVRSDIGEPDGGQGRRVLDNIDESRSHHTDQETDGDIARVQTLESVEEVWAGT